MPNTPRLTWPYPSQNKDPWFDEFKSMVEAMDASGYASREDRHLVLMGGGTVSWSILSGVGTLTWTAPMDISASIAGFLWTIPAGSIQLTDGEILYVSLVRAPSQNTQVSAQKASQVPSTDGACLINIRRDSRFFFRNGDVLQDGDSLPILDTTGGAIGAIGQKIRADIAIALNEITDQSTYQAVGNFQLNPNDYLLDGTTLVIKFAGVSVVSSGILTGNILLRNLTDASDVATLIFTSTTPTKQVSGTLSLPMSAKMYEVRLRVTGGTPPLDTTELQWAGFEIDRVF